MRKRNLFMILIFWACGFSLYAQNTGKAIPEDKMVKKGKLANGMTYYIRKNSLPVQSACFYLVTRVGALMEDDDQNGLAHFLEHMAFNGTRLFPGNSMIATLERNGIKFGENLNAYTSTDQTVYNIKDAPIANKAMIDTCLMVLSEWSDGIELRDKDIDEERGVIVEEWRTRRTSDARVREQLAPVLYNGSKYASRDVIGDLEIIKKFPYKRLRKFYADWHRPNLQAVIIVGDFNVNDMERRVVRILGNIPAQEEGPEHFTVKIPNQESPLYAAAADAEQQYMAVSIAYRHRDKDPETLTKADYRDMYIANLYNLVSNERFADMVSTTEQPFLQAQIGYGGFLPGYSNYSIIVVPKKGEELAAVRKAYMEHQDIRVNGITNDEFLRARANLLLAMENSYKQRHNRTSESFVEECKNNYLYGYPIIPVEMRYKIFNELIGTITPDDLKAKASEWVNTPNVSFIVSGPENQKEHFPTLEELTSIVGNPVSPGTGKTNTEMSGEWFIREVTPGKVVSEEKIPGLGAEIWTLSNGAKVVYKKCNQHPEQIMFCAKSKGGVSLYPAEDIPSTSMVGNVLHFGLGELNFSALQKMLAGKDLGIGLSLDELYESVNGESSLKDFETLLQVNYLLFVQPRFDRAVFDLIISNQLSALQQRQYDPMIAVQDSVNRLLAAGSPRYIPFDESFVRKIEFEKVERIYRERFSNAGDFYFYIVGDINKKNVVALAEKYIASLPSSAVREEYVEHENNLPRGKFQREIAVKMTEPKGMVFLNYRHYRDYTMKERFTLAVFDAILRIKLNEVIREKEGGTYTIQVSGIPVRKPREMRQLNIQFECEPGRMAELRDKTYEELAVLCKNGVPATDFNKAINGMIKGFTQETKDNQYWMASLTRHMENGDNPEDLASGIKILGTITLDDVNRCAREFFGQADLVEIMVKPQ